MMEIFVDREMALKHIDDAFEMLQDKKRLLRTPIMNFYGARGIGKTFFLKKVQQRCRDKQLRSIWLDGSLSISDQVRAITQQVQQSGIILPFEDLDDHSPYQSAAIMRNLLRSGPVVILGDAMDTNDTVQLNWLEILLRELINDNKLFVVFTSRRDFTFENERLLARKLTTIPLSPFDRVACEAYLDVTSNQIEPEIRTIIFTWTHGYPLALSVMTRAVMSHLDPRKDPDWKEIIAHLTHQVLYQSVLVRVNLAERDRYLAVLSLLSVPRHFNLVMMQDLIEQFTPELARENSLAYFSLPKEINQVTEVLHWSNSRAGFSVDAPVRTIFLLKLKREKTEMYYAIHRFLSQMSRQWAKDVPGADRVRYLCEYFYHGASSEDKVNLAQFLTGAIQEIKSTFPESIMQFAEEIAVDEEIKEVLGVHFHIVESLITKE